MRQLDKAIDSFAKGKQTDVCAIQRNQLIRFFLLRSSWTQWQIKNFRQIQAARIKTAKSFEELLPDSAKQTVS